MDPSLVAASNTPPNQPPLDEIPMGESVTASHKPQSNIDEAPNDTPDSDSDDEFLSGFSVNPPTLGLHPMMHDKLVESCRGCRSIAITNTWWCSICDITVCDTCWEKQLAHSTDDGRVPHAKCEPELQKLIERLKPASYSDSRRLGESSFQFNTKWFGVRIMSPTNAALETTSRFNDISMSILDNKFPSLISFVGETGSGKSTLISALLGVFT